jgi:hypothetical protein
MNNLNLKNVIDQLKVFQNQYINQLDSKDEKQIAILNQVNKIAQSLDKMNKDFEKDLKSDKVMIK